MRILLALIEIFGAIKLCASFPVTAAVAVGEQNAFMLGTVTFFIFGIAIVGCVCCRRRKKGFEEFQNESGTIDGNKTEYPIFRALSPDNNQRNNDSSLNPNVIITVNNSNEHLIGDDNDNNNGPISSADLENIENNNAANYIQNQNEIINLRLLPSSLPPSPSLSSLSSSPQPPTQQPSSSLENENFIEVIDEKIYKNHNNYDHYNDINTNNDVISSSSSSIKNNMTINSIVEINSNALNFSDHDDFIVNINNNNNDNISNEKLFINSNKTPNFDTKITTKSANNHHQNHHHHQITKNFYNTNNYSINNTVNIINEKFHSSHNNAADLPKIFDHKLNTNNIKQNKQQENIINIKSDILQYNEKQRNCHEIIQNKDEQIDETSSVVSNGTSKSNDDNSVEEALRVLDDAIKGEEYDIDLDENNDINDEDFNENSTHFQYVIQQLLINNSIEDEDDKINSDGGIENIQIIQKSLIKQHQQQNDNLMIDNNDADDDNTKEIYLKSIRNVAETLIDSIMKESEKIAEIRKYEQFNNDFNIENNIISNQILLSSSSSEQINTIKRSKSLENFFMENIETSTPCVHNKYALNDENNSFNKFSKKCLNNLFETKSNNVSPEILATLTEDIIKKSSLSPIYLINQNENEYDDVNSPIIEHKIIVTSPIDNKTFDINNVTYELNNDNNSYYYDDNDDEKIEKNSIKKMNFIHPDDPCTSRQALERDCCRNRHQYDEDINSDDLTTLTPLNTPIELNYPYDTWNKMMQQQQLQQQHNQQQQNHNDEEQQENLDKTSNNYDFRDENHQYLYPQINEHDNVDNQTFDVNDDDDDYNENDEANLQLTFETLKKQLAEILPQPQQQSLTGPPEYSDDEQDDNESNRTFDEYRSPLDGIIGLLEAETSSSSSTVQNEVFINYKRSLSPIMEESEEETYCKTFVMNETKCLDSTSGCVETGEAIMGVTKTLMASNDTLFNFEDTLGEKEDVFSPRIPSRSDIQNVTTIKSGISTGENSITTPTESSDTEKGTAAAAAASIIITTEQQFDEIIGNGIINSGGGGRRTPPKTIDFIGSCEIKQDSELCSPDQQKTFSEGTSSTDRISSSDISPTVDHDTTFTTNTIDDKTCVTVIIKDDERISEISEPEWGSTASYGGVGGGGGGCDLNSLTDIPSLDFNITNFENNDDEKSIKNDDVGDYSVEFKREFHDERVTEKLNSEELNDIERDSYHDDSGHSTQASITDDLSNGQQQQQQHQQQNYTYDKISNINNETLINSYINKTLSIQDVKLKEQCENFIKNEIIYSSPEQKIHEKLNNLIKSTIKIDENNLFMNNNCCIDHLKENNDPNITNDSTISITTAATTTTTQTSTTFQLQNEKNLKNPIINQKVQLMLKNDIDDNDKIHHNDTVIAGKMTYTSILTTDNLEKEIIDTYNDVMIAAAKNRKQQNEQKDNIAHHQLSGEEDPWIEPLKPRSSEICNEWDSDVDDSHSSEEFMYIRGSPSKEDVLKILNSNKNDGDDDDDDGENLNDNNKNEYVNCNENDIIVWSSNNDNNTNSKPKKMKKNSTDDELSEEESSSEEFVPSCWNSMAIPARSALKSPEKPVNKNKKNRNVAFKKQRYHSVYEYPKETTSLPSSYSESSLWNKNSIYFDTTSQKEEFGDGFTVSSSMRPFHGCQFNALCHTWPIDSDFSWSQIIEELDSKPLVTYSDTDVKSDEDDITKNKISNGGDNKRPDSGVGESAEMLSDRTTSVGELCHTKSSLHLPLEQIPTSIIDTKLSSNHTTISIKLNNDNNDDIMNNKDSQLFKTESIVLPTPSCTGSMDSLSSNSSSERQTNNFTTFGKFNKKTSIINDNDNDNRTTTSLSSSSSIINNDLIVVIGNGVDDGDGSDLNGDRNGDDNYESSSMITTTTKLIMNGGDSMIENNLKIEKIRQSDSTDEDSGIESIVKVNNK